MDKKRPTLSKMVRFAVFKRDLFVCQYCGRHPPEVVLEIDHIIPVASGGSDKEHNLLTSCFDCNRGKAAGSLVATPIDVSEKSVELAERLEQSRAYEALLQQQETEFEVKTDKVEAMAQVYYQGVAFSTRGRRDIRRFLKMLPCEAVVEAMDIACHRWPDDVDVMFRYFCGVCWRKIKGD